MNAREWLSAAAELPCDVAVVGAPVARSSMSPSRAWATPVAFRETLERFTTWDGDHGVEVSSLRVRDAGDIVGDEGDANSLGAQVRLRGAVDALRSRARCVVVIGGDNSIVVPVVHAMSGGRLDDGWGLVTLDAHHDVRPRGADRLPLNGSPVRDLVELGLPGKRVAQVGLHGFANEREHAEWAAAQGVQTRRASGLRRLGTAETVDSVVGALAKAGARRMWADVDLDVLDRAYAPACPASMPGGLTPWELQDVAYRLGREPRVAGLDLCEVDATEDVNGITLRAMASVFLAFCAGLVERRGR
jgi:formiminoglutamase